jgi:hypothetical protein
VEILNIVVSRDEKFLAVISGVNQIKEMEKLSQILIYGISDSRKNNNIFKLLINYDIPEEY